MNAGFHNDGSAYLSSDEVSAAVQSERGTITDDTIICYGSILSIPGRIHLRDGRITTWPLPVKLESGSTFTCIEEPKGLKGTIFPDSGYSLAIQEMLDDDGLHLYVTCNINHPPDEESTQKSCGLDVTVYGPAAEFEDVGDWFQAYHLYLQDPRECHMDTKYCNPHRLSFKSLELCHMVSDIVAERLKRMNVEDITMQGDVLEFLEGHSDLEETNQPEIIKTKLKRHQRQALTFMLNREQACAFNGGELDMWKVMVTAQGEFFFNTVSESYQKEEPPQCYGGIIADPMGFGKTLTMIALMATDTETKHNEPSVQGYSNYVDATLIVVPPSLLSFWTEQLSEHVLEGKLRYRLHHGREMAAGTASLNGINIVLTTYHTVSAEWKLRKKAQASPLFMYQWRRVILDEAHLIRTAKTLTTRAICAIESVSRWAVTGSPIQNTLTNLAPLVEFLRAYPYTDTKQFQTDFSRLWKAGHDKKVIQRLKRLSACLILRRPKGTIIVPPRDDEPCPVELSDDERIAYNGIRQGVIAKT